VSKNILKRVPCIRCGVCCVSVPCLAWDNATGCSGLCPALIIHKEGHTSCKNIIREGDPFGEGCVIRGFEVGFELIKKTAEMKAGIKLPGIGVVDGETTSTKNGGGQAPTQ